MTDENLAAAFEGLRHLARTAESDKLRFRACEYLLPVPMIAYKEGLVDPANLPRGAVPVCGDPGTVIRRLEGADIG